MRSKLPRFYFPLVVGIELFLLALLILILIDVFPLQTFHFRPDAGYFSYIVADEAKRLPVTVVKWFFWLLTAGVLIPTSMLILGEMTRWGLNRLKARRR